MVPFKQEGQFVFPERKNPRVLLFFVLVDVLVNARGDAIDPAGYLAAWIKCFGKGKIVHQRNEAFCCFIRIVGRIMLIFIPFINILFNEHSLAHLIKIANFRLQRQVVSQIVAAGEHGTSCGRKGLPGVNKFTGYRKPTKLKPF
jgi:hypothetical protein